MKVSPLQIATLSLIPGLGHWVLGKRWRACALFLVDGGVISSIIFLRSIPWGYALISITYLMAMIPAVVETYALSSDNEAWYSQSKPYIVTLLLLTGSSALPLLWQNNIFTKRNKILISIAVLFLAVMKALFFGVAVLWVWKHIQR